MGFEAAAKTHAEVRVTQGRAEVPAQAAPALTAQHVGGRSAAKGLESLPAHLEHESN